MLPAITSEPPWVTAAARASRRHTHSLCPHPQCAMASSQQQHPRPPSRTSAAPNARSTLSGRISALSASLRLHRGQDGEGAVHNGNDRNSEQAETESIASTLVEGGGEC
jgi:hypothetical protein